MDFAFLMIEGVRCPLTFIAKIGKQDVRSVCVILHLVSMIAGEVVNDASDRCNEQYGTECDPDPVSGLRFMVQGNAFFHLVI